MRRHIGFTNRATRFLSSISYQSKQFSIRSIHQISEFIYLTVYSFVRVEKTPDCWQCSPAVVAAWNIPRGVMDQLAWRICIPVLVLILLVRRRRVFCLPLVLFVVLLLSSLVLPVLLLPRLFLCLYLRLVLLPLRLLRAVCCPALPLLFCLVVFFGLACFRLWLLPGLSFLFSSLLHLACSCRLFLFCVEFGLCCFFGLFCCILVANLL